MAAVSIRNLSVEKPSANRSTAGPSRILREISLDVEDGELLVLIGPSGCGKSTLLRCLAGLETPSAGEIAIDGQLVNDMPPRDRDIAMVFQSYALYPHMTVFDNLAFGLRMRKTPAEELARRVNEALKMLEIDHLVERYPRELSGGQRQRVAMGRAVVRRPHVFLFDEPLSNLDAALRQQMRLELLRLHQRLSTTTIYVTHDQVEAMTLAHRIAVLKQGEVVQVGSPTELYDRPANSFVARFFGTPEMNLIDGQIRDGQLTSSDSSAAIRLAAANYPDGPATVGVRAEDLLISAPEGLEKQSDSFAGHVDVVENHGFERMVHVRCGSHSLVARCSMATAPMVGQSVGLRVAPGRAHLFARAEAGNADGARLEPRS